MNETEKNKPELMSVTSDSENIIITIPLDLLVFSQENREQPYLISDKKEMARWIVENILDFSADTNRDTSDFEYLLDGLFDEAFELSETWLDFQDWLKEEMDL